MHRFSLRLALALTLLAMLAACETTPRHKLHYRVLQGEHQLIAQPRRALLLPLSIEVKEMSAAGVQDEVGSWTEQAKGHIGAALASGRPQSGRFELTPLPTLSVEEDAAVTEHIALFNVVAGSALGHTMIGPVAEAWRAKAERFDYTLGPGLSFLAERTGSDTALILFGEDVISTGGRKAAALVGAVFGVVIPLGHSFLIAGLIDLPSGDIVWMDYTLATGGETLLERADVDALLLELFSDYPGLEAHRKTADVAR